MKPLLSLLISLVFISCSDCSEEKFETLFNGKDFTNWGGEGKTEKFGYIVKDGVIESTPKCRFLITDQEYENYVLKFEFQLTPGANNGLGIHYPGKGDAAYAGMEIQILDNTHPKYAKLKDYQFHGGLYTLKAAEKGHLMPVGEWNKQTVTINGPKVIVELNGTIVMEANLDEINQANPKHEGAKRRKGHLAFCGHGDIIRLKNLQIRELK